VIQFNVSLLFTIINLIVFYLLLKKFLFKPVMGIMEKREKLIADGLKNASDSQEEAARLKAEYEKALEGAKAESIQIVEKAKKTAAGESERILQEANTEAVGILKDARETIENERKQTMNDLQSEIAGLAMQAARKIVDDTKGNQDIYDQFLKGAGDAHVNEEVK